jgi:hypothetical protein
MNTVYIGYDPKEDTAYEVLKFTIERISGKNIRVVPLRKDLLELTGMYRRKSELIHGQPYDVIDGRPFSTEFSFSRFLVPALNLYEGKALFMDSDMYLRADVNELFEMCDMDYYPVYCVHHKYEPENKTKMDGKEQQPYRRKNWSSLMMFNCGHQENKKLTPDVVNTQTGRWLHSFGWLPDKEADIGKIPEEWNWLDGHSSESIQPKVVHFTTGGPLFRNWEGKRDIDNLYAKEWQELCYEMKQNEGY